MHDVASSSEHVGGGGSSRKRSRSRKIVLSVRCRIGSASPYNTDHPREHKVLLTSRLKYETELQKQRNANATNVMSPSSDRAHGVRYRSEEDLRTLLRS